MSDENVLTLDGKTFKQEDLTSEQIYFRQQIKDLKAKIVKAKFELDQIIVAEKQFNNLLITSLKNTITKDEKKEVG